MPDYVPQRDSDLLGFAENFSTRISASPLAYGLTSAMAAQMDLLYGNFSDAMRALNDPQTKSPHFVAAKNLAREALVDGSGGIRQLANLVQATPTVTDLQRIDLRLTVRDREPSPVPSPAFPPSLEVEKQFGRNVQIRLRDMENPTRRGKPDGVIGAMVFMHVGDAEPPQSALEWTLLQNTSKNVFTVEIPTEVASGSKVWFTAQWFNRRQETGPPSAFQNIRVGDAKAQAA